MPTLKIDVYAGTVVGSLEVDTSSSTWIAVTPRAFGEEKGVVSSWGTTSALLSGGHGIMPILELEHLKRTTKPPDNGKGSKMNPDGQIPYGDVNWKCLG